MSVKRGLGLGLGVGVFFFFFFLIFFFAFFFLSFVLFSLLSFFFLYDNNGNNQRPGTNRELRAEYHGMVFNHFSPKNGHVINHFSHVGRTNVIMEGGGSVHGRFLHILVHEFFT